MKGGETSGKASSGRRTAAIRPITNSDTKNMIAVTGRLMLSSAMRHVSALLSRLDLAVVVALRAIGLPWRALGARST